MSYYRIDLKNVPKRYEGEALLKVLRASSLALKREVERFAYYFRREFHYDFVQFEIADSEYYTAYLFAGDTFPQVWAGACCFRNRHFSDLDARVEALQWIWLHPYLRGRGILRQHWKTLRENHGDFFVEPPVSPPMKEFLLKHNKGSIWYPLFEGNKPDIPKLKAQLIEARANKENGQ